jgi:hypothetical protein
MIGIAKVSGTGARIGDRFGEWAHNLCFPTPCLEPSPLRHGAPVAEDATSFAKYSHAQFQHASVF